MPRSSPGPGGSGCARSVEGMNGGVAGGALAAGDAGKPGAPEDAARARGYPEAEEEGQRVRQPALRGIT